MVPRSLRAGIHTTVEFAGTVPSAAPLHAVVPFDWERHLP